MSGSNSFGVGLPRGGCRRWLTVAGIHSTCLDRSGPSTFCLSRAELAVEVQRRQAEGWAPWELRAVFVNPSEMAA